jgi:hypothetical protein
LLCRHLPWFLFSFPWATLLSFKVIFTLRSVTQFSHFGCVIIW